MLFALFLSLSGLFSSTGMPPVLAQEAHVRLAELIEEHPHMGGEDFAFFAREVPALYYFLGSSDAERGVPGWIHTANFQPEKRALEVGMRSSLRLLLAASGYSGSTYTR